MNISTTNLKHCFCKKTTPTHWNHVVHSWRVSMLCNWPTHIMNLERKLNVATLVLIWMVVFQMRLCCDNLCLFDECGDVKLCGKLTTKMHAKNWIDSVNKCGRDSVDAQLKNNTHTHRFIFNFVCFVNDMVVVLKTSNRDREWLIYVTVLTAVVFVYLNFIWLRIFELNIIRKKNEIFCLMFEIIKSRTWLHRARKKKNCVWRQRGTATGKRTQIMCAQSEKKNRECERETEIKREK